MNPYEKYQQQVVTTMTQGDMLLKLYDEIIRQIDLARAAIREQRTADMDTSIQKAQRIVRYLRSCLNQKYKVSGNLHSLYNFFDSQLMQANIKKDVKSLDDIEPLVQELRDTFSQCAKMERADRSSSTVADVV